MCDLCSSDKEERKSHQDYLISQAEALTRLANSLRGLAFGRIEPHSDEAARIGLNCKSVIRYLVSEWL